MPGKMDCSIDWSNGKDNTCITFMQAEGKQINVLKVITLTPEETFLLMVAIDSRPVGAGAFGLQFFPGREK